MKCPRCERTTLDERDRDGVTIDVCSTCRGVWLDRGELEKLIARTTAEFNEYEQRPRVVAEPSRHRDEHDQRPREFSEPSRHRDDDDHRKGRRKKGWLESLGDIFD